MLDKYLEREDISNLINEIKRSPKYGEKNENVYSDTIGNELALYTFYDALLKYKIILDDEDLLDTFVEQLDKIYKKIDNYNQVMLGVNKLICFMVSKHLNISDLKDEFQKEQIIKYIYNKYIVNGYYVHGFSSVYADTIKENGFVSEIYENNYSKMIEIREIFKKYNLDNILDKDFSSNQTYFTDDFIMGCHYSDYAPGYFSSFLLGKILGDSVREDSYLKLDYDTCTNNLKRFMSNHSFSDDDREEVLNIVSNEWNFVNKEDKKISLLMVKRGLIDDSNTSLSDFIDDKSDVYDVVDRLLSAKNTKVGFNDVIDSNNLIIVSLENYYSNNDNCNDYQIVIEKDSLPLKNDKLIRNRELLNTYGKVYIFLIIGSIFITLGVIITIIMIIRGI